MVLFCLVTLAIAFLAFQVGTHLSEEAEAYTILALIIALVCLFLSLVFLPWFMKLAIVTLLWLPLLRSHIHNYLRF